MHNEKKRETMMPTIIRFIRNSVTFLIVVFFSCCSSFFPKYYFDGDHDLLLFLMELAKIG